MSRELLPPCTAPFDLRLSGGSGEYALRFAIISSPFLFGFCTSSAFAFSCWLGRKSGISHTPGSDRVSQVSTLRAVTATTVRLLVASSKRLRLTLDRGFARIPSRLCYHRCRADASAICLRRRESWSCENIQNLCLRALQAQVDPRCHSNRRGFRQGSVVQHLLWPACRRADVHSRHMRFSRALFASLTVVGLNISCSLAAVSEIEHTRSAHLH